MLRVRALFCSVLSRVVSHDISNITAMTALTVAMFVFPHANNDCRQVLALAVANRCFRLVSTTQMVAVRQTDRAHDRMYNLLTGIVCVCDCCNCIATIRRRVDRGKIVRRSLRRCHAPQLRAAQRCQKISAKCAIRM